MGMRTLRYNAHVGEGSHLPVLMDIMAITDGPVLELGMGLFSTPYFHWACYEKKRQLLSCESRQEWIDLFEFDDPREVKNNYEGYHRILKVDDNDWTAIDSVLLATHWSVVLVDQSPGPKRKDSARLLANNADYIVVHDANGRHDKYYHLTEIYPLFKYRYNTRRIYPEVSVLSNFKDVSGICTL